MNGRWNRAGVGHDWTKKEARNFASLVLLANMSVRCNGEKTSNDHKKRR
jgi:hypothetical protein